LVFHLSGVLNKVDKDILILGIVGIDSSSIAKTLNVSVARNKTITRILLAPMAGMPPYWHYISLIEPVNPV
jgi:hypothetical protein